MGSLQMNDREVFEAWNNQLADPLSLRGEATAWNAWQAALAQQKEAQTLNYTESDCLKSEARWEAQQEPVGKVLEVADDGSFQAGFFVNLPYGTLLYAAPQLDDSPFSEEAFEILQGKVRKLETVLRMALEALDDTRYVSKYTHIIAAIAAIREQLGETK
jgi:hypothetical protein